MNPDVSECRFEEAIEGGLLRCGVDAHVGAASRWWVWPHSAISIGDLHRPARTLLVGADGIALDAFLERPLSEWVSA